MRGGGLFLSGGMGVCLSGVFVPTFPTWKGKDKPRSFIMPAAGGEERTCQRQLLSRASLKTHDSRFRCRFEFGMFMFMLYSYTSSPLTH